MKKQAKGPKIRAHGPVSERFMRHHYGASGYVKEPPIDPLTVLINQFRDLAVDLEKHSNDHIHDELPDNLAAAVEGVCADRINAILKPYRATVREAGPARWNK